MNILRVNTCDATNGPGVRCSIWVAGCGFHCSGCFNKTAWNFSQGKPYSKMKEEILNTIGSLEHIAGVSLLGGEPLWGYMKFGDNDMLDLCRSIKERFPKLDIWMWSGFEWKDVKDKAILKYIDTIITGQFVERLKDLKLEYMGSSNQEVHHIEH